MIRRSLATAAFLTAALTAPLPAHAAGSPGLPVPAGAASAAAGAAAVVPAGAAVSIPAGAGLPVSAGATARPGLRAEPGEAAAGTTVRVRGSAWTPGAIVQFQVCGQNAVHGSADCDTRGGVTARVAPTGLVEAGLTVGTPPAACPCVLRAATLPDTGGAPLQVAIPFTVLGHRVGPILPEIVPVQADVAGVEVVGGGGWSELFGGRPHRTLVVRIRNAGADPIENAPLVVGWGPGETPENPLDAPRTGDIAPGETVTYRIPVELPPASFGTFSTGGRFAGSVPFTTSFSTYPWGLIGVNVLAALLLLLGIRLTFRRRSARRAAARARGAVPAAAASGPPHHRTVPRSPTAEVAELLSLLDRTARAHDDPALLAYLRGRDAPPVDLAALDRFLGDRR